MSGKLDKRKTIIIFKLLIAVFLSSVPISGYGFSSGDLSDKPSPGITEGPLTLEKCVEIALSNSPRVEIGKGDVEKAQMAVKDAKSGFLPRVDLSGGYSINDRYSSVEWDSNHYDLSVSASITPFSGGRNLVNVKKSNLSLEYAEQGYNVTEAGLIIEVVEKYFDLLKSSELLSLREDSLQKEEKHLEYSKTQYQLGLVPKSDVLKAEAAAAGAEVDLLKAEGQVQKNTAELNSMMGLDPSRDTSIEPVRLDAVQIPRLDTCVQSALEQRPEIKKQQASISMEMYNVKLARIENWPSLSIEGSYNVYADEFLFEGIPVTTANLKDQSEWRVGIELSFPVFDGGITSRNIRKARIDLENTRHALVLLEREIELEVNSAYLSLLNASREIELTKKQLESTAESYNAAEGRYINGIAPITEVIDARLVLTEARVRYINAKYDYLKAEKMLYKTTGKLRF